MVYSTNLTSFNQILYIILKNVLKLASFIYFHLIFIKSEKGAYFDLGNIQEGMFQGQM